jgi:hypothetical protein
MLDDDYTFSRAVAVHISCQLSFKPTHIMNIFYMSLAVLEDKTLPSISNLKTCHDAGVEISGEISKARKTSEIESLLALLNLH